MHTEANVGAYATTTGVIIQLLIGPWVSTSVYDIQTIDFKLQAVLTNTTPLGTSSPAPADPRRSTSSSG